MNLEKSNPCKTEKLEREHKPTLCFRPRCLPCSDFDYHFRIEPRGQELWSEFQSNQNLNNSWQCLRSHDSVSQNSQQGQEVIMATSLSMPRTFFPSAEISGFHIIATFPRSQVSGAKNLSASDSLNWNATKSRRIWVRHKTCRAAVHLCR